MDQIIELIKQHDWKEIFSYVNILSDAERLDFQKKVSTLNFQMLDADNGEALSGKAREVFYENRQANCAALEYAALVSVRNFDEMKTAFPDQMVRLVFGSSYGDNTDNHAQKIYFFSHYPPNYIDKIIKEKNLNQLDFELLWTFYKNGWVKFNEELFVNSLFYVQMFSRSTEKDAAFLIENPDAIEKILLQFYRYEVDILDISKWEARDGFQCTKIHHFWTEVFTILIEKGVEFPRSLITNLFESLLNHWKKPHLNWHIQMIKLFAPTSDELIANQQLLFAALSSENNTIVNYVVGEIKSIHKAIGFDFETCFDNLSVLFVNEKINKSLMTVLKIVDYGVSKHPNLKPSIAESLCLGLTTSNTKMQTEFANRIVTFCPPNELEELVLPYLSYLKSESKEILAIDKKEEITTLELEVSEIVIEELNTPKNWEELLGHISKTIRTKDAADMDILLESIIQLNEQLPPNYQKQLSSFKKQLARETWDTMTRSFSDFFRNWINNSDQFKLENFEHNPTRIPFLTGKMIETFNRIKSNNKLPFIATPTHSPCFVHPEVLVERLLAYEKAKKAPDWIDLTVACNRILKDVDPKNFTDKANTLKGNYAKAINYLIGNSEVIDLEVDNKKSSEGLLNLWAQITRTKNANGVYNEFKDTALQDLQSVIRPFDLGFEVTKSTSDSYTWYALNLDQKWNAMGGVSEGLNNYLYSSAFPITEERQDMLYQASMVVNYIDPFLCSYVFFYCNTEGIQDAPLKFTLDHNIKVHHSGWIYIAACLLTNDKATRALAQEYILQSVANKTIKQELLAEIIAKLVVSKFFPVKRLTDYLEQVTAVKDLKELHFEIVSNCIKTVDLKDKPRSFTKIVALYKEFQKDLKIESSPEIIEKLKGIK